MALVVGPVAGGKSELLKIFAERSAAEGATVLEAVGSRPERELTFGVLEQLFGGPAFSADARRISGILTDSESRLAESGQEDRTERLRNQANKELWAAIRRLSEDAPVVITIDDLHDADMASLHSVLYFSGRVRSTRVLIVATQTECPLSYDQPRTVLVTELLRQPRFCLLRTDALSPDAVNEMLTERLGAPVAGSIAQAWHRLSGGSPFLLKALIEDYAAAYSEPTVTELSEPVVGAEFAKTTLACLHRGGRRFLRTARGIAVLAQSGSFPLLSQLLSEDESVTAKISGVMEAAGVLAAQRFRHPIAQEAVLTEIPVEERAGLHRRVACLLYDGGAEPYRIGVHLVAAKYNDVPWALDVLMATAEKALWLADVDLALKCLQLAEDTCETDEQRMAVLVRRTQARFRVDPGNALRDVEMLIHGVKEGRVRIERMVALLCALLWQGQHEEAVLIHERLGRAAEGLDEEPAAALHALREWLASTQPSLLMGRGQAEARTRATAPPGVAADPSVEAAVILRGVLSSGPDENTVPAAERILQTASLSDGTLSAVQHAILSLVYADRTDLAEHWCGSWLREATMHRAAVWQAVLLSVRAEIAIRRGAMHAARRYGGEALELIPRSAWGVALGDTMAGLLLVSTAMGEVSGYELAPGEIPDGLFETCSGLRYLYARGRRRSAANRP